MRVRDCGARIIVAAKEQIACRHRCLVFAVLVGGQRVCVACAVRESGHKGYNSAARHVEDDAVGVSAVFARVSELCNAHVFELERAVFVKGHDVRRLARFRVRDGQLVSAIFCDVGQHFHAQIAFKHGGSVVRYVKCKNTVVAFVGYIYSRCGDICRYFRNVCHRKHGDKKHERKNDDESSHKFFHINSPYPNLRTPF